MCDIPVGLIGHVTASVLSNLSSLPQSHNTHRAENAGLDRMVVETPVAQNREMLLGSLEKLVC